MLKLKKDALINYLNEEGTYDNEEVKELWDELEDYEEEDFLQGVEIEGLEVIVLTEEEADERAAEEIKQSLWAFYPEWIANFCNIPADKIEKVQGALYEDCNDLIELWIEDMDDFITSSISEEATGRGHFISSYDGEEAEICSTDGTMFCLYRLN
jgi:hypothetical protein